MEIITDLGRMEVIMVIEITMIETNIVKNIPTMAIEINTIRIMDMEEIIRGSLGNTNLTTNKNSNIATNIKSFTSHKYKLLSFNCVLLEV